MPGRTKRRIIEWAKIGSGRRAMPVCRIDHRAVLEARRVWEASWRERVDFAEGLTYEPGRRKSVERLRTGGVL